VNIIYFGMYYGIFNTPIGLDITINRFDSVTTLLFFTLYSYPSLLRERTDLACYDAVYNLDAQFLYDTVMEVLPVEVNNFTNEFPVKRSNTG